MTENYIPGLSPWTRKISDTYRNKSRYTLPLIGDFPTLWCEILDMILNGCDDIQQKNWDYFLTREMEKLLENEFTDRELFYLWYQTKYALSYQKDLHRNNKETQIENLANEDIFTLSEEQKEELASVFYEEFYSNDLFDLDEEITEAEKIPKNKLKGLDPSGPTNPLLN